MGEHVTPEEQTDACSPTVDCVRAASGAEQPHELPYDRLRNPPMETAINVFPCDSAASALPECRICQEEDDPSQLEAPCHCSGTLKFAHRECLQKWCNEKGNTVCEICLQSFKQDYCASQFQYAAESVALEISDSWGIELRDPRILALAAAHRQLLESDSEVYPALDTRNAACCRFVVLILMAILFLRYVTAMSAATDDGDSLLLLVIFFLRLVSFLLPCYIMVHALSMFRQRQPEQVASTGTRLSFVLRGSQPQAIRVAFVPSDLP